MKTEDDNEFFKTMINHMVAIIEQKNYEDIKQENFSNVFERFKNYYDE